MPSSSKKYYAHHLCNGTPYTGLLTLPAPSGGGLLRYPWVADDGADAADLRVQRRRPLSPPWSGCDDSGPSAAGLAAPSTSLLHQQQKEQQEREEERQQRQRILSSARSNQNKKKRWAKTNTRRRRGSAPELSMLLIGGGEEPPPLVSPSAASSSNTSSNARQIIDLRSEQMDVYTVYMMQRG